MKAFLRLLCLSLLQLAVLHSVKADDTPRQIIAKAALETESAGKRAVISTLVGQGDEVIRELMDAWKTDALFIHTAPDGSKVVVQLSPEKDEAGAQAATVVATGETLKDAEGKPMRLVAKDQALVEHDRGTRAAMKGVLDLLDLSSPDTKKRIDSTRTLGFAQNAANLPAFETRLKVEKDEKVLAVLRESIAVTQLKDPSDEVKLAALKELKTLHTLTSYDILKASLKEAEGAGKTKVAEAAQAAIVAVDSHRSTVNFFGTIFRGASKGSILLVAALGLAITFGLMGVINMAHGEMIAIGAYTTYVVQCLFGAGLAIPFFGMSLNIPGMNASGGWLESYFLFALPLSFMVAALVGVALERGVIQFLYRRPLESLLATWGVSLVLQQAFRMMFGSNNVSVTSPIYLSGNWTVNDILFGWNRVFVIGFAVLIVVGTWLVLTKTSLGLLIRAVMQNRNMASCMGVRTQRVNMMTFGFGSGLAGLAGAFLSQIGNVGPSLGQDYIVDCFMTVVVGGVGNLVGTVVSAVGIGMADQSLQQILLNPVLGKILVLVAIILFLQWRPAGIFVTRSRSLD